MFEASKFLSDKWGMPSVVGAVCLSHYEATIVENKLYEDACKSLYSSIVSIADALRGIEDQYYTWGGVKLYYSVFYSIRAALALDRYCIFYVGKKPKWTYVAPGAIPNNPSPRSLQNTHKIVLNLFRAKRPGADILSQTIGSDDPFAWMMERREEFNYKHAKFSEPEPPPCFRFVARSGMRKSVIAYIEDDTSLFAFDEDHAILAYPIQVLKWIRARWPGKVLFAAQEKDDLRAMLSDRHGPLQIFGKILDNE